MSNRILNHIRAEQNGRISADLSFRDPSPERLQKAGKAGRGGRWLCMKCCKYQTKSHAVHDRECQGFVRTSAK
jgi:hypothetical protein